MKWPFACKYNVCSECGVVFKPHKQNLIFSDLCKSHRDIKIAEFERQQFVLACCSNNWVKLERFMNSQYKKHLEKHERMVETAALNRAFNRATDFSLSESHPLKHMDKYFMNGDWIRD